MSTTFIIAGIAAILIVLTIVGILSRYRKCKSNEILIVYGKTGGNTSSKVYHGGAAFVWPVIQGYEVMSIVPLQFTQPVDGLSAQNIITHIPVTLTTAVSRDPKVMQNVAERFLGVDRKQVESTIRQILIGEVRAIMATMNIEEINADRTKFLEKAKQNIETELNKVGYTILNINTADISDDAQYIQQLGKKAATQARAQAEADIAEQEKQGAIKIANTQKERDIAIAEAEKTRLSTVANTQKDKDTAVATAEKEKAIALAEIAKQNAVAVAEQEKEKEISIAAAIAEQNSKVAEQEAVQIANVAKAKAEAESKKAEADAEKLIRIKNADQKREAENIKATREREAKAAEYASEARKRQAEAEKAAGVAEQTATIEVSKAKAEAAKAKADAERVAGVSHVEAEMQIAKTKQERQIEVNEAAAKANEKKLYAEQVVPAEAAKKRLIVEAEAGKEQAILEAEAEKQKALKVAEAQAESIRKIKDAEAEGTKKILLAEADGLRATAQVEVDKQKGLAQAEVAGILQLGEALGDPEAAVQFFMKDVTKDIKVAEAYAGSLREVMGNVTVYGDAQTAGNMATSMLKLIPQLKQMGVAVGEGVKTVKTAFSQPAELPEPKEETDFEETK